MGGDGVIWITKLPRVSTVERYDPDEDRWTPVRSIPTGRYHAGVCCLGDMMYVVGGHDGNGGGIRSVEVYNVNTDSWSRVRDVNVGRFGAGVVAGNGLIYVVGGREEGGNFLSSMEVYNPAFDTWTILPCNMSRGRAFFSLALMEKPCNLYSLV